MLKEYNQDNVTQYNKTYVKGFKLTGFIENIIFKSYKNNMLFSG